MQKSSQSLAFAACCLLMAAGASEPGAYKMTMLAIAAVLGLILASRALRTQSGD